MHVNEEFLDSHTDVAWLQGMLARRGVEQTFKSAVLYSEAGVPVAVDLYKSREAKITHPFVRVAFEDYPL